MAALPKLKARGSHFDEFISRLAKFKTSMSMTRKVLRFGKEIPLIVGIRNKLAATSYSSTYSNDPASANNQPQQRMILYRILSDLALILYFFTDHPLYLHNVGFRKFNPEFIKNIDYINNVFWLLSSLFDIMVTVVEISHLQK